MSITEKIELCKELKKADIIFLCEAIHDAYERFDANNECNDEDRFFLGLRYSEFLAKNDSDEEYFRAERRRQKYLDIIGTSTSELNLALEDYYGLK